MSVGNNIRKLRQARGWTILELANRVESDVGNLSRLERGKQGYSDDMLRKVAFALGCPVGDLFAGEAALKNVQLVPLGSRRIPVIGHDQVSQMQMNVGASGSVDSDEWLLTDRELSPHAFALSISGDSMTPEFKEGDRVIIDPSITPQPGDFVVAKHGDKEIVFHKFRPRGLNEDGHVMFELVPQNEDYPSLRSDRSDITIVGTMVEHRRYRKR